MLYFTVTMCQKPTKRFLYAEFIVIQTFLQGRNENEEGKVKSATLIEAIIPIVALILVLAPLFLFMANLHIFL